MRADRRAALVGIAGIVGEQIDAGLCRAVGGAFAHRNQANADTMIGGAAMSNLGRVVTWIDKVELSALPGAPSVTPMQHVLRISR